MGRILIAVLIIWIIVKITKAIFQKSCVGCRKRISKKANVCSYCRTQQPEVIDKELGKKFFTGLGKMFSLAGSFIVRKRTKLDAAFVLIAVAGALFISVNSYSWYIDTMKSSYEKNAIIEVHGLYRTRENIPNAGTSIIYAEQERDKKNVIYALLGSYDINRWLDLFMEDLIYKYGVMDKAEENKEQFLYASAGRSDVDARIRPYIFWEDTSWRFVYGNDSPMPSKKEVEAVIASDPHLKGLPNDHFIIRLLRGEFGQFSDAFNKGYFDVFPIHDFDEEGEPVQGYHYDNWVNGQDEWNPYAKDEFWAMSKTDMGMVAEYAILRHRYGVKAAQRETMIRRPSIIYVNISFNAERRASKRISKFGLRDDFRRFNGDYMHVTPTTLRFQEGIEHVPYTYDLMQDKKLVHDLFSGNAYTFAWMYAFPISLLFGLMAFSFVRFLGFVFLGQKEVTENVKVRKHTIPCRHCRVEIADFDECCYSCGKTQKV